MTFEERLRADVREAMSAQGRAVTDDWMERSAENHFGSSAYFAPDSDDEGACEEKETAAEIHAIKYYGGEVAVNHQCLSCTALLEHVLTATIIDWPALKDIVSNDTESGEITETMRTEWQPSVLDPTQRFLHDHVTRTWLYGATCDYVAFRPLPDLGIKDFGTTGSGKTRLNRTMVITVRSLVQSMRDLFPQERSLTSAEGGAPLSEYCLRA